MLLRKIPIIIFVIINLLLKFDWSLLFLIKSLPKNARKEINILKSFFRAGIAGSIVYSSVFNKKNIALVQNVRCSCLFGYWAILLQVSDLIADSGEYKYSEAVLFNLTISDKIVETFDACENYSSFKGHKNYYKQWKKQKLAHYHLKEEALNLPEVLVKIIARFNALIKQYMADIKDSDIKNEMINYLVKDFVELMDGQIKSQGQKEDKNSRGWDWYKEYVLTQKLDKIFVAPLWLVCTDKDNLDSLKKLQEGIMLISNIFVHRQILDDMIDMENDQNNNILSTPSYIIKYYDLNKIPQDDFGKRCLEYFHKEQKYIKGSFTYNWDRSNIKKTIEIIKHSGILQLYCSIVNMNLSSEKHKCFIVFLTRNPKVETILKLYYKITLKSYNALNRKCCNL